MGMLRQRDATVTSRVPMERSSSCCEHPHPGLVDGRPRARNAMYSCCEHHAEVETGPIYLQIPVRDNHHTTETGAILTAGVVATRTPLHDAASLVLPLTA
ncbi:hypothetical protein LZ554_007281 [Drepanopeziza brunnea f. sp. 'monogermtubi']|nr:hypothetical protein LZ554_007281 [Drepanopeziza brunnea f. sp. 'monogermtubi']